jgi:hypothetical protein
MNMNTTKLFKPKPADQVRSIDYKIKLNQAEADSIRQKAELRNLSMAEYMRRASLGRKADIHFETEIILTLRDSTKAIRTLHADYVAKGLPPPTDELCEVIRNCTAAMLRVGDK